MGAAINLATLAYTEVDPNGHLSVSTVTASHAAVTRQESCYVYYDWSAGYFGDFVHDFECLDNVGGAGCSIVHWGVSNTVNDTYNWTEGLYLRWTSTSGTNGGWTLYEVGGSSSAGATFTKGANMFWRVERNGSTLTAKRATSAANRLAGTWAETLTISVATTTYRYHYAVSSYNDGTVGVAASGTSANHKGTTMTSAGTPFDTAYMVGASSGDWNAGATWGNAGSTKGTDFPGNASDVFNVDAGDTVTYNVSEANALLGSTIYGTLTFKKDANTKLQFGAASLTVKNGGFLLIGTAANPIDSSHTAEMYFAPAGDNAVGLTGEATGTIEIEGTDLNGGTMFSYLISDWSGGQTFTVHGDVTADWVVGQKIVTHRFPAAYSAAVNSFEYTIASLSANGADTDITISEAAPGGTFRAGALVANTTRNIIIGKTSAVLTLGNQNGNRPFFHVSNPLSTIKHATFVGIWSFGNTNSAGQLYLTNVVVRNSGRLGCYGYTSYGLRADKLLLVTCPIIQLFGGYFTNLVSFCLATFVSYTFNSTFDNMYVINGTDSNYGFIGNSVVGCYIKNVDVVDMPNYISAPGSTAIGGNMTFANANFGKYRHNANVSTSVYFLRVINGLISMYFYNLYLNATLFVYSYGADSQSDLRFDDFGGVLGDTRRLTKGYDTATEATVVRSGGSTISLAISRLNNSAIYSLTLPVFEWVEWDVPASEQTRKIYIRGGNGGAEDWSTFPTAAELFLEAEYYDEAGTCHKAFVVSTAVLTDNTTWTAFPVTFTPGRVGQVVYRLRPGFVTGVADVKLYVDPQLNS
jgi:hypothetical protein